MVILNFHKKQKKKKEQLTDKKQKQKKTPHFCSAEKMIVGHPKLEKVKMLINLKQAAV